MKKSRIKKFAVILVLALLVVAVYLFFSRPITIQQRFPMLSPEKCTGMEGYYRDEAGEALQKFTVHKNSEEFAVLWELLYEQAYHREFRDLLPKGTRVHAAQPGDFEWEVFFLFDKVELSDGNTGSGGILRIQYWYGELEVYFEDNSLSCHVKDQETWAMQVLDIIR